MNRKKIIDALELAAIAVALAALIMFPRQSIDAARGGVELCFNVIVPSLFPFFVLSTLIVETGVTRRLSRMLEPVMRPLFNVNGSCVAAFALGFVGGYPIGAKTVIALYENGDCTKTEAERLLSFCNNSGPAFIFGVVGAGVFSSGRIGLLLYLAHSAASILVGILFRFHGRRKRPGANRRPSRAVSRKPFLPAFTDSIKASFQTTLNICGFVIFFTVFIRLLFLSGALPAAARALSFALAPLGLDAAWAERLITGAIEMTSGVWSLQGAAGSITSSVAMAAFMLGWAGLSVHTQVLSFIGESGLSVRTYVAGKFLQGVFSAGIIALFARAFDLSVPAAVLAGEVTRLSQLTFFRALTVSVCGALALFALLILAVRRADKVR